MTRPDAIELTKSVLFEFAKAVYICQCFESSLCFLLALMAYNRIPEEGTFSDYWDFNSTKTLGQLLKSLRWKINVSTDLDEYLGVDESKRNEIVHSFITKNFLRLADPKGRIEIEKELRCLKQEIKKRDIVVNKLINTLLAKYGLSNDIPKRIEDNHWQHINPTESKESTPNHWWRSSVVLRKRALAQIMTTGR